MKYATEKIGSTSILVTADGKPVPHKDTDTWTFHILPKLYLPSLHDVQSPSDIKFAISCPELGEAILPESEIIVRQPYPNPIYYVAGTKERKMGWTVELPADLRVLNLSLEWIFADDEDFDTATFWQTGIEKVIHNIEFLLTPTLQGHVYSMAAPGLTYLSSQVRPISFVKPDDSRIVVCDEKQAEKLKYNYYLDLSTDNIQLSIEQKSLVIDSCAWSDLLLDEIEEMTLLRDIEAVSSFSTHVEEHRRNACCEIPARILYDAIAYARSIPFGKGSPYENSTTCDRHPAMQCLAKWWNSNAPNPLHRIAGHAKVWVRVADDDDYWSAYYEEPNRGVINGVASPHAVARWNDFVLIEFAQPNDNIYLDENFILICLDVTGDYFETVGGISKEEYDPAWYSLEGLRDFPERFPVAWEALCDAVGENSPQ